MGSYTSNRSRFTMNNNLRGCIDGTNSCKGKSLSEALIFASTNPQYDTDCSLFMKIVSSEYLQNMLCTQIVVFCFVLTFRAILVHNWHVLQMLRASEKDLPVWISIHLSISRVRASLYVLTILVKKTMKELIISLISKRTISMFEHT